MEPGFWDPIDPMAFLMMNTHGSIGDEYIIVATASTLRPRFGTLELEVRAIIRMREDRKGALKWF